MQAGDLLQAVLGQRVHRQQVRSYSDGRLGVVLLSVRLVVRGVLVDQVAIVVVLVVPQVGPAVARALRLRLRDSAPGGLRGERNVKYRERVEVEEVEEVGNNK